MSENKSEKKDTFLLARISDACQNNYEPQYFDFYDEVFQQKIADTIKYNGVPYLFFGGHLETERKMLCIYPDYISEDELDWPIFSLEFKKTFQVDHRNILGELMHLGITRESIGDIDVGEERIQIIAHSRLKDFLWLNFNKVKGREVRINFKEWKQIETYTKNYKRLSIVVASNRLDGIINKIWGFSRQNSLIFIKQGKVRVNYSEINKNDYRLQAGDVISLRGKGKAKIISMDERTKKGNLRLEVDRYI
jgi:RNA-binding protein YlmH